MNEPTEIMQWPIAPGKNGKPVMVRLQFYGQITKQSLERLHAYISLLDAAWFPDENEPAPHEPSKEKEEDRA